MRRRRSGGFILLLALMLSILLLVVGMGYLSEESLQYRGANSYMAAAQAREIAIAGMTDAVTKLDFDISFPPPTTDAQPTYTYGENFLAADGTVLGTYTVTVDRTYSAPPYQLIRVTSVARLNNGVSRKFYAELDVAPQRGGTANPWYHWVTNASDMGSL